MSKLETLRIKNRINPVLINWGEHGEFYRVSRDLGVKVLYDKKSKSGFFNPELAIETLKKEWEIQQHLHDNDINVPEPLGIFRWKKYNNTIVPGFFMEYIPGKVLGDLAGAKRVRSFRKARYQIEKATNLGVEFGDDSPGWDNAILSNYDNRVYLIDFNNCRM